MSWLGTRLDRHYNGMGGAVNISPYVSSTSVQNAILSLPIIHTIPSCQINVTMETSLLVLSVSWIRTTSYHLNYMHLGDDVSHSEDMQLNDCQCMSHMFKFLHGIEVTRGFMYCGELQGYALLNESSIFVQEHDFELSLQLPWDTPIQRILLPFRGLLGPHPVVPSVLSVPALPSWALPYLRYTFAL